MKLPTKTRKMPTRDPRQTTRWITTAADTMTEVIPKTDRTRFVEETAVATTTAVAVIVRGTFNLLRLLK
jgi:hypothetical protein